MACQAVSHRLENRHGKTNMTKFLVLLAKTRAALGATLGLAACGGDSLDVGTHDPQAQASAGSAGTSSAPAEPMPLPSWPPLDDCPSGSTASFIGVWEGVFEDAFFQPVRPLRIELTGEKPGGLCGTVTWGAGNSEPLDPAAVSYANVRAPADGQTFGITAGGYRDNDLRVAFVPAQQWNAWCSAQRPFVSSESGYGSCLPGSSSSVCSFTTEMCSVTPDGGETFTLPLSGVELCRSHIGTCLCNAVSCIANPDSPSILLQLSIDGDVASGRYQEWGIRLVRAR